MTHIKICGLSRLCDIDSVNIAKPEYVGFVFAKSRRQITPTQALSLREKLNSEIIPVGVFVNENIDNILALVSNGAIDAIQLHGDEDEGYISKIKSLTDVTVIKSVSVSNLGDVQKWKDTSADYLLLDKKGGGTGEVFDWNLIGETNMPFFLAGGLNTTNILTSLNKVKPFAVDISSGVETDGLKDCKKILDIIRMVREANE